MIFIQPQGISFINSALTSVSQREYRLYGAAQHLYDHYRPNRLKSASANIVSFNSVIEQNQKFCF